MTEHIFDAVLQEVHRAMDTHAPFHSCHEGYAKLLEELEELWEEVRKKPRHRSLKLLRQEAVHVAAKAIRFAIELDGTT